MPAAKKRYYSVTEIGEILGVSKEEAYAIMRMLSFKGMAFKVGRLWRTKIEVFEAWLEEQEREGGFKVSIS